MWKYLSKNKHHGLVVRKPGLRAGLFCGSPLEVLGWSCKVGDADRCCKNNEKDLQLDSVVV